jgi:hypothetical protein
MSTTPQGKQPHGQQHRRGEKGCFDVYIIRYQKCNQQRSPAAGVPAIDTPGSATSQIAQHDIIPKLVQRHASSCKAGSAAATEQMHMQLAQSPMKKYIIFFTCKACKQTLSVCSVLQMGVHTGSKYCAAKAGQHAALHKQVCKEEILLYDTIRLAF